MSNCSIEPMDFAFNQPLLKNVKLKGNAIYIELKNEPNNNKFGFSPNEKKVQIGICLHY